MAAGQRSDRGNDAFLSLLLPPVGPNPNSIVGSVLEGQVMKLMEFVEDDLIKIAHQFAGISIPTEFIACDQCYSHSRR